MFHERFGLKSGICFPEDRSRKNPECIRAGWVIDGSGGPVRSNMVLTIQHGMFQSLESAASCRVDATEVLDLSGFTIIPGLVDAHVHLFMSGTEDRRIRDFQLEAPFEPIAEFIASHLDAHLACGVIGVRDGGDREGHALRYRKEVFQKDKTPIQLKLSGKAWHQAGRYGRLIGRAPRENESLAEGILRESSGQDWVKIVNSGINSLTRFGKETLPQFDVGELAAAVTAARSRGLKTMVHANGRRPVEIAIQAGCDSIEHGFFMGQENLKRLADSGTVWIPTACTMKAYAACLAHSDNHGAIFYGERVRVRNSRNDPVEVAQRNLDHQLEQMAVAKRLGVVIALGTDAGSIGVHHGKSVIDEMKLLIKAGFSVSEAVQCATRNGAALIGMNTCGMIQQGRQATFLAIQCSPEELPDRLDRVDGIVIDGRIYDDKKRIAA